MSEEIDLRFGVFVPDLGEFADCRRLVELAQTAEAGGWDGFFIWDTMLMDLADSLEIVDPWIVLVAIAAATTRLRIGQLSDGGWCSVRAPAARRMLIFRPSAKIRTLGVGWRRLTADSAS